MSQKGDNKGVFNNVVANFTSYSAILSSITVLLCIFVAVATAKGFYAGFNIDFFAKADFGDYLNLGIRKFMGALTGLVVSYCIAATIVSFIHSNDIINNRNDSPQGYESKISNPFFALAVFIFAGFVGVITDKSALSVSSVINGTNVVNSIVYGKAETKLNCLVYIGDIGGFSHYWSLKNKSSIAINTTSVHLIETMFAPQVGFIPPTKGSGMKPAMVDLHSREYKEWEKMKEDRTSRINTLCK